MGAKSNSSMLTGSDFIPTCLNVPICFVWSARRIGTVEPPLGEQSVCLLSLRFCFIYMHKPGMNSNSGPLGGAAHTKWSSSNRAHLVSRVQHTRNTSQNSMYHLLIVLLCFHWADITSFPSDIVTTWLNRCSPCLCIFLSGSLNELHGTAHLILRSLREN